MIGVWGSRAGTGLGVAWSGFIKTFFSAHTADFGTCSGNWCECVLKKHDILEPPTLHLFFFFLSVYEDIELLKINSLPVTEVPAVRSFNLSFLSP